ncbi:MAG: MgtC/SapB family protein [Deltaproteobacteria bacterium]
MSGEWIDILGRLLAATAAGAAIGLERTYHGRPAGFRTHTLVCVASSLLMALTMYQSRWFAAASPEIVRIDPTRMAQGVMTGIGFLGAGVIMREGLTVRGLTTAASIWITAAIGILAGVGFYSTVAVATVITLGVLTVFREMENRMPAQIFARLTIACRRSDPMSEEQVRDLLSKNGFSVFHVSYRSKAAGEEVEYRMTIRTKDEGNVGKLSRLLTESPSVAGFDISMTGE